MIRKQDTFPFFYIISIIIFCAINCITFFDFSTAYKCEKFFLLLFVISILLCSVKRNGCAALYSLFLFFSLFFLFFRIFFDLIGFKSITIYNFVITKIWREEIIFKFLNFSFFYLIIIDFFYYISKPSVVTEIPILKNNSTKKITLLFFIVFSCLFAYKSYLDMKMIQKFGYTASLANIRINYPFWLKGSGTFFYIFFYALLMHELSKRELKVIFLVYVLLSLLSGLRGARAAFFLPVIFALFYLNEKKILKINLYNGLIIVICFTCIIFLITFFRGEDLSNIKKIGDVVSYVFYGQTQTFNVPMFFMEYKSEIQSERLLPYIFSDLLHKYIPSIQDGSMAIGKYNHLPEGLSLGDSLYLELLDLPLMIAFFICACIGRVIKFVQINFLRNRTLSPLFFCSVTSIFYMPRNILFSFLGPDCIAYFIFSNLFILCFLSWVKYCFINAKDRM